MKKSLYVMFLSFLNLNALFSSETTSVTSTTDVPPGYSEVSIVGGGIIGAFESYYAYIDAVKHNKKICVTVYEKCQSLTQPAIGSDSSLSSNTAFNIVPSLTIDEILSVVPRGNELIEKLGLLFSEPGGIRVDDVHGLNDSESAVRFKEAVSLYGNDKNHDDRTLTLLKLGKISMNLWKDLHDHADPALKAILEESNFNPCSEQTNSNRILHDGYRIDLIYEIADADKRAHSMRSTYDQMGYKNCKVLTPNEVESIDPALADFCRLHSHQDSTQGRIWNNDTSALWRPGGCVDTRIFVPKFFEYLKTLMGTYTTRSGKTADCFQLKFNKEVVGIEFSDTPDLQISGLKFKDGSTLRHSPNTDSSYVFCPGEAVGTLNQLGFKEPAYAGFAGPSLFLQFPLLSSQLEKYKTFSHCMEVHKIGVCLAWQARIIENTAFIGVAGTKAFYGDKLPLIHEAFANNKHLVQLNMINDVLPELVSIACGNSTEGKKLTPDDIKALENKGFLKRWVGRRAVAYDGFPTLGALYCQDGRKVANARCTTHCGSGGVSFSPAVTNVSRYADDKIDAKFLDQVLKYADSRRYPG